MLVLIGSLYQPVDISTDSQEINELNEIIVVVIEFIQVIKNITQNNINLTIY